MRKEYDLREGGRVNPYAKRLGARGRAAVLERFLEVEHLVRLDDDVAAEFKDAASVNEALRLVTRLRKIGQGGTSRSASSRPRRVPTS